MKATKISPTSFFRPLRRFAGVKRLLFFVRVEGESAWPELIPGKRYLASNLKKPGVGDFIVFKNPRDGEQVLVKQITSKTGNSYSVAGTLSWATSSKDIGLVPQSLIMGTVLSKEK